MKIVSVSQMMSEDREATVKYGIPGCILMENAASECVRIVDEELGFKDKYIVVVCGGGNNGGDGLAIARKLFCKNYKVAIYKAFDDEKLKGDSQVNYDSVLKLGVPFVNSFSEADIIIDALLGIGIKGDVREKEAEIIRNIAASNKTVVSVDVPSGICADTGRICGEAVCADITISMGYGKPGLYTGKGKAYSGKVYVADISLPPNSEGDLHFLDYIPDGWKMPRNPLAHKGDNGKVLIVAGSKGMTGAAALTAIGAHRAGAGIVKLVTPENLNIIYETKLTETITIPVKDNDFLTDNSLEDILSIDADALIIGPGLGRNEQTVLLVHKLIKNSPLPLIIDADGIYALSLNINVLKEAKADVILLPHGQEFSRLIGVPVAEIENNRISLAKQFAKEYNVTLLLKGAGTVIAESDGNTYINSTGNEGMAKGGSGDVLCGIAGAYVAKKIPHSVAQAAFIHGAAGDKAAEIIGTDSMLPTDILKFI